MAESDERNKNLYLDLLIKSLTNSIYGNDKELNPWKTETNRTYDETSRITGDGWPSLAHTMVGVARLENLRRCAEDVIKRGVQGDFVETGVWRGGCCILMQGVLKAINEPNRRIFVCDSFEGLPVNNQQDYPHDNINLSTHDALAVGEIEVINNFKKYDLLDANIKIVKGYFKDTLQPLADDVEKFALLRLDGDYYESTIQALEALYPKLEVGGIVIIDDYKVLIPCQKAVHEYREKHGITSEIKMVDGSVDGAFWIKE